MDKLKELSIKGWIATVLMFGSLAVILLSNNVNIQDTFTYFAMFGLIGLAVASCEGDSPIIQIGDSKNKDDTI